MDYKDKIRKLLALAKSPEPEEAKFALLKARKLMAEHKLSERDLEERNTTVIKRAIGETFSKKANSWMDPLSIVIGENYCCSAFRCKISVKTTVWHVGFIGLEGDIEICVKIFRYAVRCIKSEQKKLRKQHRDYYTPQEIAKICDSYGYGFARGVYEAFTRQNEENQEYGLVLKVPKEVKDELEKIGPPKEFKKTPQPKTVGELDAAWLGSWGESAVQEFIIGKERTYYREDDICEMNDVLYERYDPELVDNMTDEETRAAYNALPWKKAIFVDVHQYEEEPDAEV